MTKIEVLQRRALEKKLKSMEKRGAKDAVRDEAAYNKLKRLHARRSESKADHTRVLQEGIKELTVQALKSAGGEDWDSVTKQAFRETYAEFVLGVGFKFEKVFQQKDLGIPPVEVAVFSGYSFVSAARWVALGRAKFNPTVCWVLKQLIKGEAVEQEAVVWDLPDCAISLFDGGFKYTEGLVRDEFIKTVTAVERVDVLTRSLALASTSLARILSETQLFEIVDGKGDLLEGGYQAVWKIVQDMTKAKFLTAFHERCLFSAAVEVKHLYVPPKKSKLGSRFIYSAVISDKKQRVLVPEATQKMFGKKKEEPKQEAKQESIEY